MARTKPANQPVNIPGVKIISSSGDTPLGDGILVFEFLANKTLRWAAAGDSADGQVIFPDDSVKVVPSANGSFLTVHVDYELLPSAGIITDTITIVAAPETTPGIRHVAQRFEIEQSVLELLETILDALRAHIDYQFKAAHTAKGVEYTDAGDKVKSFRLGGIKLEAEFPALTVYPMRETLRRKGNNGIEEWDYLVSIDGFMTGEQADEEKLSRKISLLSYAAQNVLLPLYPTRGQITEVRYADITIPNRLLNGFSILYSVLVNKRYEARLGA